MSAQTVSATPDMPAAVAGEAGQRRAAGRAVFTAFMTFGAHYVNLPAFLAFALLVVVHLLAGIANIAGLAGTTLLRITGWIGVADGICAWWVGFGLVLKGMGPRPVIPLISYPYGK